MASVRAALARPQDEVLSLIAKGLTVTKFPWTNTRIAVKLEALCGVPCVASAYNTTFLYSIALAAEVEMNAKLTEKQAEVSFALKTTWLGATIKDTASAGRAGAAGGPELEVTGMCRLKC